MTLEELQRMIAAECRTREPAPPADFFDSDRFPFGTLAGANKLELRICATCGRPATPIWDRSDGTRDVFLFRDELSAREYTISGMCQACQDATFGDSHES
jgi:hypothetical protein